MTGSLSVLAVPDRAVLRTHAPRRDYQRWVERTLVDVSARGWRARLFVKQQYEQVIASGGRIAGPAADLILGDGLDEESVHWLKSNFFKTELELGHCLRLPQEGPCECDLYLRCSKIFTTSDYASTTSQRVLRAAPHRPLGRQRSPRPCMTGSPACRRREPGQRTDGKQQQGDRTPPPPRHRQIMMRSPLLERIR